MGIPPIKSSNQRETKLQSVTYRKAVCLVSFFIGVHKLRSQPHQTHSHPVYNTDAKGGYRKCKSNTEQCQEVSRTMQAHKPSGFVSHWPWMSSHQISQLSRAANPKTNTTKSFCGPDLKWPLGQINQTKHDYFFFLPILKRGGNLHNINIFRHMNYTKWEKTTVASYYCSECNRKSWILNQISAE